MSLGANLKGLLKKRKLDQKTAAQQMGIPANTLCDWVNDNGFPRRKNLERLAAFFETTPAKLIA